MLQPQLQKRVARLAASCTVNFHAVICRAATIDDLEALIEIEALCFSSDKLSRRSFRHHIKSLNSDLLVAQLGDPSNEIIARRNGGT